jgi:hypothetical protein
VTPLSGSKDLRSGAGLAVTYALMPLTMRPTLAEAPAVKREVGEDWGR